MNNMTITELKENETFVFGSNKNGHHEGGAARTALQKFGAIYGQGFGLQGQSYAIPTLDENMKKVPLEEIGEYLKLLTVFAADFPEKIFFLTPIGTGIAGYSMEDLESVLPELPSNIILTWK